MASSYLSGLRFLFAFSWLRQLESVIAKFVPNDLLKETGDFAGFGRNIGQRGLSVQIDGLSIEIGID